jgi:hypothetical protein
MTWLVAASLHRGELFVIPSTAAPASAGRLCRGYKSFSFGAVSGDQGLVL